MIAPMLAKAVGDKVPDGPGLLYEPKWDGFRCIVFRGETVVLQSRKEEDFSYLFPEVVAACEHLPVRTTLDGELVIVGESGLEFDLLSNRIRPRSEAGGWKITSLSEATPRSSWHSTASSSAGTTSVSNRSPTVGASWRASICPPACT